MTYAGSLSSDNVILVMKWHLVF